MIRTQGVGETEYVGLLRSIFEFLLISGSGLESIKAIVERALAETTRGYPHETSSNGDSGVAAASRVLDAWHRHRRYLDKDAVPRAIPLLGRSPSVEALVRMESSRYNSAAFARRLKSLGLLSRSGRGRYKPATRIALIGGPNPLVQQYVARSSATLLRTIRHNVSRQTRSNRLIERFTEVPDLPARHASAFRKFSHEQGLVFLNTLNDWLEARRARGPASARGRTVRAGLHMYAYLERENSSRQRREAKKENG